MGPGRVSSPALLNGVELSWREHGAGPAVLLLHETATNAEIWQPLIAALGGGIRTIAPDRRGWGASGAPEHYVATTVEEQAADAAVLLEAVDAPPALACGAGIGAAIALELLLRRGDLVGGAVLIEPPLLAYLPEATQGIAADRQAIADAVHGGGPAAAIDLYVTGGLGHLGAGAERIPAKARAAARRRPLSLFAELGAVPAWPLRGPEMSAMKRPSRIVIAASTPAPLRGAAEQLSRRLGSAQLLKVGDGDGLPHVSAADQVADLIRELAAAASLNAG